jgi:chemotaxis response regulator CheB
MIQVNFPISGTIAFDIHVTDEFARNLNGYFLAMVNGIKNDEWLKKGRMQVAPTNHYHQTKDVLCHPKNPVTRASEPNVRDKFYL